MMTFSLVFHAAAIPVLIWGPDVYVWWRFKDCVTKGDAMRVLVHENHRAPLVLLGIPTKAWSKADAVFYHQQAMADFCAGYDSTAWRRAMCDEMLRRPKLAEKLADAAVLYPEIAIGNPLHPPLERANAAAFLEYTTTLGVRDDIDEETPQYRAAIMRMLVDGLKRDSGNDFTLQAFFCTWAMAGRPISLKGMTRANAYLYRIELARWCEAHRDRLEYDPKRQRFALKPVPPGAKPKPKKAAGDPPTKTVIHVPVAYQDEYHGMKLFGSSPKKPR